MNADPLDSPALLSPFSSVAQGLRAIAVRSGRRPFTRWLDPPLEAVIDQAIRSF